MLKCVSRVEGEKGRFGHIVVKELHLRAGIGCRISANVEGELWAKMIINCAYNAVSALGRSRYAVMREHALTQDVMRLAALEAIATCSRRPLDSFVLSTLKIGASG